MFNCKHPISKLVFRFFGKFYSRIEIEGKTKITIRLIWNLNYDLFNLIIKESKNSIKKTNTLLLAYNVYL